MRRCTRPSGRASTASRWPAATTGVEAAADGAGRRASKAAEDALLRGEPGACAEWLGQDPRRSCAASRPAPGSALLPGRRSLERGRSEEHTSETPVTNTHIVFRLMLDKKKSI